MENGIIGKRIKVIFEDGKDHVSRKQGVCTRDNDVEIGLSNKHLIPKIRIIRVEVLE